MKIADILNLIDSQSLALPVFQRGYVWQRSQVKDMMNSLYRGYPIGSLLTWTTRADQVEVRGIEQSRTGSAIELLLDGQQRVTSLYGLIRGTPPSFFEGNAKAFTDLYFSLSDEEFEFFAPVRMRNNPLWVSVHSLFVDGSSWITPLVANSDYAERQGEYLQRGLKVGQIQNVDLPILPVTGDDKTTEVVVDIFNRVNSGGTKLSKGDLALARIGAYWPEVRIEMQQRLAKWGRVDFKANLDWLLRCMNVIINNSSELERLEPEKHSNERIQLALQQAENAVDHLLEAMRSHLYMDVDRVYNSKQALPVMVKYLVNNGGQFPDHGTMVRVLHWYVSSAIWGRFSGPVETTINQDLLALEDPNPLEALLRNLRLGQGDRSISHENFDMNYTKSRFYPMIYVLSRIQDARDWGTGNRLRHHSLGDHTNLELHHIFPRAYLRRNGVSANDANNMGNIAFQTRETNRAIGSSPPEEYMPEVIAKWPGALESQWIPTDTELWKVENYRRFLDARRRLLAESANEMLRALQAGVLPPAELRPSLEPAEPSYVHNGSIIDDSDNYEAIILEASQFASEHGLSTGETAYEIFNEETGEITVLDLAWPDGLQTGYSQPIALINDEDDATWRTASGADFRVFTSLVDFRRYVEREILADAD